MSLSFISPPTVKGKMKHIDNFLISLMNAIKII